MSFFIILKTVDVTLNYWIDIMISIIYKNVLHDACPSYKIIVYLSIYRYQTTKIVFINITPTLLTRYVHIHIFCVYI